MLNDMICWNFVTTKDFRREKQLTPGDWTIAGAVFFDEEYDRAVKDLSESWDSPDDTGIAVILYQDDPDEMPGTSIPGAGLRADIWTADLNTGKPVQFLGSSDEAPQWAEDIKSVEDIRKACVNIIRAFKENRTGFISKGHEKEAEHAGMMIRRFYHTI